jgi:hypothetical protein
VEVAGLMELPHGCEALLHDEGNRGEGELLIALLEELFYIEVELLHDDVGILLEFLEGVDLWEMAGAHEIEHDLKLFFDEDQFLRQSLDTFP